MLFLKVFQVLATTITDSVISVLPLQLTFASTKYIIMKIIITGSLGHISKPLTQTLVQKGHSVTVISSQSERQKDIEALGAKAAIGSIEDVDFLAETFTGADAAYLMVPTVNFRSGDIFKFWVQTGENYAQAIQRSGVKRVVHLSSIGAHTDQNNGMLRFAYQIEQVLKRLPENIAITTLRPVGFYNNLMGAIHAIKTTGSIVSNYKATYKEPWVSPSDIAAVAAEEITQQFTGRKIRYIASDELTSDETASILGAAIGQPDLKWTVINDEQLMNGLIAAGMNPQAAKGLVEMNAGLGSGTLFEDYNRNRPNTFGKVQMKDFAREFAAVYHQK